MSHSIHILVVDDEPPIRAVLRKGLEAAGYVVSEAGSKAALMRRLENEPPDHITLDLGLGTADGLTLARQIRARRNVPIIMITGRDTPEERLAGLEPDADDYIVKPFLVREVLLRVQAVLARYDPLRRGEPQASASAERYQFEAGTLDVGRRELRTRDGDSIALTEAEVRLLGMQHAMIEQGEALARIWRQSITDGLSSGSELAESLSQCKSPVDATIAYGNWVENRYRRLTSDCQEAWQAWQGIIGSRLPERLSGPHDDRQPR